MKKVSLALVVLTALAAGDAHAAKAGDSVLRAGPWADAQVSADDAWHALTQVSVKPKTNGICVVSASGNLDPDGLEVNYTLATAPDDNTENFYQGEWDLSGDWQDWAMTQAFKVKKGEKYTFYLNVRGRDGDPGDTFDFEVVRIWALCQPGKKAKDPPVEPLDEAASNRGGGRN